MSSKPAPSGCPAWNDFVVATFAGQHDTHIDTGEDYATITLSELFATKPQAKSKMAGNAFLPSSYYDYDARSHEAQRGRGSFVALVGDIDKADLPIEQVRAATERFTDGAAWLIYSSAHSRDGDRRWRIVVPLDQPIGFTDWFDAQTAFFTFMEGTGAPMDRALSRAGQPVYLPNVPHSYKDGTPLRDQHGDPIYYQTESSGTDAPGLDIARGIVAGGISSIRQQRAADDRERDVLRAAAAERYANRPQGDGSNIIERFNTSTSIATMLELCGYEQSPRSGDDWRSPLQTGETYATRIIENKWVSLSQSDAASGLGSKCKSGCFGDAYDLYVHFKHGGDHKSAYRQLGQEQRGHNVVQGNFRGEDPGWQEMPEWAGSAITESEYVEEVAQVAPENDGVADLPGLVSPANWVGRKAPHRRFIMPGWIVRGACGLLSGQEGVGKSLLAQQMATCVAMGRDFLGLEVESVPAVYITCEDDQDELWRRQEAINASLGITMADISERLLLSSLKGEIGNELGTFDQSGRLTPSDRYRQIRKTVLGFEAGLAFLDNAAHLFTGNENARHDVAAFLGLCERLSLDMDGAVILLAHPNKQHAQGNTQGNEYSGSTGWSAHVRNRLFLDWAKKDADENPLDEDGRLLRKSKANYGKKGEEIFFRWHEWAFATIDAIGPNIAAEMQANAAAGHGNKIFLECLDKAMADRVPTSASRAASNYAPRVFSKMPTAKKMSVDALEQALQRLLHLQEVAGDQRLWQRDNRSWVNGLGRI